MSLLRVFGPGAPGPLDDDELLASYPWPESGGWVRAMMVTTLDGAAAGPDGLSGSISSPADRRVFDSVRRHADAVLIGAGTLRSEQYQPMRAKPADQQARIAAGQLPAPVIAVVSGSLELPWQLPIWTDSEHRPIVFTSTAADPSALALARAHTDMVDLDLLTPDSIVEHLLARGLRRIVCEGGPSLLRDLVQAGRLDEADITISPTMAGTGHTPTTGALGPVRDFDLAHVLQQDGFLMTRYLVARG